MKGRGDTRKWRKECSFKGIYCSVAYLLDH